LGWSARQSNAWYSRKQAEQVSWHHFAFEVELEDMKAAVSFLNSKGIKCHNRIDQGEYPQVFGWMPAVAIYFNDPDGIYWNLFRCFLIRRVLISDCSHGRMDRLKT